MEMAEGAILSTIVRRIGTMSNPMDPRTATAAIITTILFHHRAGNLHLRELVALPVALRPLFQTPTDLMVNHNPEEPQDTSSLLPTMDRRLGMGPLLDVMRISDVEAVVILIEVTEDTVNGVVLDYTHCD